MVYIALRQGLCDYIEDETICREQKFDSSHDVELKILRFVQNTQAKTEKF